MPSIKSHSAGFSLVELIVVIAIMGILSFSSVVGFGYLGDILKVNEVNSVLQSVVKLEELKVLRGDFEQSTVNFLKDYIVIDQELKDSSLKLQLVKGMGKCSEYQLKFLNKGNLKKLDKNGKILNIKSVNNDKFSNCIDFTSSKQTELSYQLVDSGKFSNIIKFVHFNLKRDDLKNPISITEGMGSKIEIKAPYGKKYFYDSQGTMHTDPKNPVKLVIREDRKSVV